MSVFSRAFSRALTGQSRLRVAEPNPRRKTEPATDRAEKHLGKQPTVDPDPQVTGTNLISVVDEAWWLLGAGKDAGARFLQRLAKSASETPSRVETRGGGNDVVQRDRALENDVHSTY